MLIASTALHSTHGRELALFIAGGLPAPPIRLGSGVLTLLAEQLACGSRAEWLERARRFHQTFWETRLRRELAVSAPAKADVGAQPGLFDRRVEREQERLSVARTEDAALREQRLVQLRELAGLESASVVSLLFLLP
jgi:hypothetical protein